MEMLTMVGAVSMMMWYLIDRFKPLWADTPLGKWLTVGLAAVLGFGLCLGFNLDIVYGLGLTPDPTPLGRALTSLTLMSGSSAVSEIIGRVKGDS